MLITANTLFNQLNQINFSSTVGKIKFNFAGILVTVTTTDTVGITFQSWIKQYLINNNIDFDEPLNTQEFPDFFLKPSNHSTDLLEVKAFNFNASPAFDIANFESYCDSLKDNPHRLYADYLIIGYSMDTNTGDIVVNKIWLHKIWEIAGTSLRFPLKTQVKRDVIYNIRPNSSFKNGNPSPFANESQFLKALYDTLVSYKGASFANNWKNEFKINYFNFYKQNLNFN